MENTGTQNEVNLRTKFRCSYAENTQIDSVRILRIHGTELYIYWEYVERICKITENMRNEQKVKYLGKLKNKNCKYIKTVIRTLDGFD